MRLRPRRSTIDKFIRAGKLIYFRFVRLYASPEDMARGVAIGLFVSVTPTSGFQMVLAIFLASILRGNQLMAALLTWITNPVTTPFIYAATYWLGSLFLTSPPLKELLTQDLTITVLLSKLGWRVFASLMIGGLLSGTVLGLIGYYFTAPVYRILRERRQQRIRRRILREQPPPEIPS